METLILIASLILAWVLIAVVCAAITCISVYITELLIVDVAKLRNYWLRLWNVIVPRVEVIMIKRKQNQAFKRVRKLNRKYKGKR